MNEDAESSRMMEECNERRNCSLYIFGLDNGCGGCMSDKIVTMFETGGRYNLLSAKGVLTGRQVQARGGGKWMEYEQRYQDKNGVEVSIKLKTEHSEDIDLRGTLNFLANVSHRFYLEAAEKIKNTL